MNIQELCDKMNKSIGLDILEVVDTDIIVVKKTITRKYIKEHFIDDLVYYPKNSRSLVMTSRLQSLARELDSKVLATATTIYF